MDGLGFCEVACGVVPTTKGECRGGGGELGGGVGGEGVVDDVLAGDEEGHEVARGGGHDGVGRLGGVGGEGVLLGARWRGGEGEGEGEGDGAEGGARGSGA